MPATPDHGDEHRCAGMPDGDRIWYSEDYGWYHTPDGEDDCESERVARCPFCGEAPTKTGPQSRPRR